MIDWYYFGQIFDFDSGLNCFFLNLSWYQYKIFCNETIPKEHRLYHLKLLNQIGIDSKKYNNTESGIHILISKGLAKNKYCNAKLTDFIEYSYDEAKCLYLRIFDFQTNKEFRCYVTLNDKNYLFLGFNDQIPFIESQSYGWLNTQIDHELILDQPKSITELIFNFKGIYNLYSKNFN